MGLVKNQLQEKEDNWNAKAEYEGWRCAICGITPPHAERVQFFETGMCGFCIHMSKKDD